MDAMHDNSESRHKKEVRRRNRPSTSCAECIRRKQRCNQESPCNNCSLRNLPLRCTYERFRKPAANSEDVVDCPESDTLDHQGPQSFVQASTDILAEAHLDIGSKSRSLTSLVGNFAYQQLVTRESCQDNPEPSSGISRLGSDNDNHGHGQIQDVSTAFSRGHYFPYAEAFETPYYLCSIPTGEFVEGGVDLEPLRFLPIEPSPRHAQLFRFFVLRLSPYMSSIDGVDPPSFFEDQYMPFIIQSPIAIHLTILTAAYLQASIRGIQYDKAVEVIAAKVKLISLINEHIASNGNGVSDDAIAAVMSLTNNELIYADERSTLAHIRGLRDMIKTRGGIANIHFPILRMMLLRTDFQVACTYECDLFLHPSEPIPTLQFYPLVLDSPIFLSPHLFINSTPLHGISPVSAQILDDVRFLTTAVLELSTTPYSDTSYATFFKTAQWVHMRLISSDPALANDNFHRTIQTTALIYVTAILHRTPLSQSCTPLVLTQLWATLWEVPLSRWKQIPGIFFWILLVAIPYAKDKFQGRFLKGLMPATTVAIGIVDSNVLLGIVRAFLGVQKWLRGGGTGEVVVGSVGALPEIPVGGLPQWSLSE